MSTFPLNFSPELQIQGHFHLDVPPILQTHTALRIKSELSMALRPFMIWLLPWTVSLTTASQNAANQKLLFVFQMQGTTCSSLIVLCFSCLGLYPLFRKWPLYCALTSPITFICIIPTCHQNSNETSSSKKKSSLSSLRTDTVLPTTTSCACSHYCTEWFLL